MPDYSVYRAKPNPIGKDKSKNNPIAKQLLGEWVDVRNTSQGVLNFANVSLAHVEYGPGCSNPKTKIYWSGNASIQLKPGQVLRVHTGKSNDAAQMASEDSAGADHHAYAESGAFILNNDCPDRPSLWRSVNKEWQELDGAEYSAKPTEGKILTRSGNRLV
jgi:hypothetical protein